MKIDRILDLTKEEINDMKVHCATQPGREFPDDPLIEFYKGTFKDWQEVQNKDYFNREYILSLISYEPDQWLFAGIYRKLGITWDQTIEQFHYETELTSKGRKLIGRLIIKFHRHRNCYLKLENQIDKMELIEIRRERISVTPYTGNENVRLGYPELKIIIERNNIEWRTALSAIKGIYVITDEQTGKLYIGSAAGKQSFWQRWSEYITNLHGSNRELREVINQKGEKYAKNFQFSILEVMSPTATKEAIVKREQHWKEVFMTREYGYNSN